LKGYRNIQPVNRAAVIDVMQRIGQLAADHPELIEIEINPLGVNKEGAVAIDTRIRSGEFPTS
jgi:acetyltransferase